MRESNDLLLTTIHKVKGQTFDAVLIISDENRRGKSKGGYWKQWLMSENDEYRRLGYVASSRPKYLLIWAISEKDKDEFKKLTGHGII